MCGRKYASEELTWAQYRDVLNITGNPPADNFQPNYNIAPTHEVPVAYEADGARQLERFKWGLIPGWSLDGKIGYSMFNARSETLTEKASFKRLVQQHRCAVMVSGFYEWKREGAGKAQTKQAHKIQHTGGQPMIMAGLWTQNNKVLEGKPLRTYTVITTGATPEFEPVHNRMPAILEPDQVSSWLNGSWDDAQDMLVPFAGQLDVIPVSNDVGSVKNNHARLLESL